MVSHTMDRPSARCRMARREPGSCELRREPGSCEHGQERARQLRARAHALVVCVAVPAAASMAMRHRAVPRTTGVCVRKIQKLRRHMTRPDT